MKWFRKIFPRNWKCVKILQPNVGGSLLGQCSFTERNGRSLRFLIGLGMINLGELALIAHRGSWYIYLDERFDVGKFRQLCKLRISSVGIKAWDSGVITRIHPIFFLNELMLRTRKRIYYIISLLRDTADRYLTIVTFDRLNWSLLTNRENRKS